MISVIHHRHSDDCDIKRGRQVLRRVRFGRSGAGNLRDLIASNYIAAAIARVRVGDEEVRHYWRCPVLGWMGEDGLACAPPPTAPAWQVVEYTGSRLADGSPEIARILSRHRERHVAQARAEKLRRANPLGAPVGVRLEGE